MNIPGLADFTLSFLSILLEGVPFILLGTLISGIVDAFVPARAMEKLLPRNTVAAVGISGGLGLIFPMCECGIVPVIRRLISKGLPVACGIAYMLSAPIVNVVVIGGTALAFQGQLPWLMTGLRVALGYLVAVAVGLLVTRMKLENVLNRQVMASLPERRYGQQADPAANQSPSQRMHHQHAGLSARWAHAMRSTAQDFLDVTFYFVIGAAITAIFNTAVPHSTVEPFAGSPVPATLSMMVLAFILSLCSSSDAFIAATLGAFSHASKLAFLVFGPMLDFKLLFLYSTIFQKSFIIKMALTAAVLIAGACIALDYSHIMP